MIINYLIFIIKACAFVTLNAQQKVTVDGKTFKSNMEVAEAQISNQKISLRLSEIDKYKPQFQRDNCDECADGKSLIIGIDFKRDFKFPITEEDSIYVRLSNLEQSLKEYQFKQDELGKYESNRDLSEEAQLENNAEMIKKKSAEITKLMQEGKISSMEAADMLTALMKPQEEALINSRTMKNINGIDEFYDKAFYDFVFYNDETLTETIPFSGYVFIKRFNEKEFVAEFRGEIIEECVAKRKARSLDDEKKCGATTSKFLPRAKVLSEGSGRLDINISIKEFINNR